MSRRERPRRRGKKLQARDKLGLGAIGAVLIASPLLLAGGNAQTAGATALLAVAASAVSVTVWNVRHRSLGLGVTFLLAMVVLPLAQLIPMPCGWIEASFPESAELQRDSASILGGAASICRYTLDGGRTRFAAVTAIAMAATGLACSVATLAGHRRRIVRLVAISGLVTTVVTLLHVMVGAELVYGFYAPRFRIPRVMGPVLNMNHLASVMVASQPLWLLWGAREQGRNRFLAWTAAGVTTFVCFATMSRGGIATLLAVDGAVLFRLLEPKRIRKPWQRGVAVVGLVAGIGVGLYAALPVLLPEGELDTRKLTILAQGSSLLLGVPVLGAGRGAFSVVYVRSHGSVLRQEHAENFLLQWGVDLGVIPATLLVVCLAVVIARALRSTQTHRWLASTVLLGLVVHDLVDFSLELTGVGTLAAALLGATARRRRSSGGKRRTRHALVLVFAVALVGLAPGYLRGDVHQRVGALTEELDRPEVFWPALGAALASHPSEPALYLLGGERARRDRSTETLRWLNRAMELAPEWPGPHVVAARALLDLGRDEQAIVEVAAAYERDPMLTSVMPLCETLTRDGAPRLLLHSLARDRLPLLERLRDCPGISGDALAAVERSILELDPGNLVVGAPRVRRLIYQGDVGAALALAERIHGADPRDPERSTILARALGAAGEVEAALGHLDDLPDSRQTLEVRATVLMRAGRFDEMREALASHMGMAEGDAQRVARSHRLAGNLEQSAQAPERALRAYQSAYDISHDIKDLTLVAEVAEELGLRELALRSLAEACSHEGPSSPVCDRHQELLYDRADAEPP